MLSATEAGYGGCIIGSASASAVSELLGLPENLEVELVLAFGAPDETVVLEEAQDGNVKYYRDADGTHHAPKRRLCDIIVK